MLFLLRPTLKSSNRKRDYVACTSLFYSSSSSSGRGMVRISPLGAVAKLEAPLSADLVPWKCCCFCAENEERTASGTQARKSLINNFFFAPKARFMTDFGGVLISSGIKCNVHLNKHMWIFLIMKPSSITRRGVKPIHLGFNFCGEIRTTSQGSVSPAHNCFPVNRGRKRSRVFPADCNKREELFASSLLSFLPCFVSCSLSAAKFGN